MRPNATATPTAFPRPRTSVRVVQPAAPTAPPASPAPTSQAGSRIGPLARGLDRLTRRWTVDLFDMDLQLESADIEAELHDRPH